MGAGLPRSARRHRLPRQLARLRAEELHEPVVTQVEADQAADVPGRCELPAHDTDVAAELAAHADLGQVHAGGVAPAPQLEGAPAERVGFDADAHDRILEPAENAPALLARLRHAARGLE